MKQKTVVTPRLVLDDAGFWGKRKGDFGWVCIYGLNSLFSIPFSLGHIWVEVSLKPKKEAVEVFVRSGNNWDFSFWGLTKLAANRKGAELCNPFGRWLNSHFKLTETPRKLYVRVLYD